MSKCINHHDACECRQRARAECDAVLAHIILDRDKLAVEVVRLRAAVARLRAALTAYVYNGHHAVGVVEGMHAAIGFCTTCHGQYVAGRDALTRAGAVGRERD